MSTDGNTLTATKTTPDLMVMLAMERGRANQERRQAFAERLKDRSNELRLTREDLSERSGIKVRELDRYRAGEYIPRYDRLQRLADALEIDVAELLETNPERAERLQDQLNRIEAKIDAIAAYFDLPARPEDASEPFERLARGQAPSAASPRAKDKT